MFNVVQTTNKLKSFWKYLWTCECQQHMHTHPPKHLACSHVCACEMWIWFYFCAWCLYGFQCVCITFYHFSLSHFSIVFLVFIFRFFFLSYSSPESIYKYSVYIVALVAVTILSFIARKHAKMSFCQCGKKNKMQVVFSAFHFSLSLSFFHSPVAQKLATPNSFLSHFLVVFPSLTTLYDSTNRCSLYTHLFTTK